MVSEHIGDTGLCVGAGGGVIPGVDGRAVSKTLIVTHKLV